MKQFLDEDFLLKTETAKKLYHAYAKDLPIIDYHCHLSPKEIYENKNYENMTEIWLGADHYKWRLLRANGVEEDYITGTKAPYEKFSKWAETVPYTIGNPLYHWSHLELKRFFKIEDILTSQSAKKIYDKCNEKLVTSEFTPRRLMERSAVEIVCTTDDPCDSLMYHKKLKAEYKKMKVLPTFRPDQAIHLEKEGFLDYIKQLGEITACTIDTLEDLLHGLKNRIEYFHEVGCVISDHGLDTFMYEESTSDEVSRIFLKRKENDSLSLSEIKKYKGYILTFLGKEYAKKNWVMQLHVSALRNTNTRMFNKIGRDTGFDVVGEAVPLIELKCFLDALEKEDALPKTILYSLNPNDNILLASLMGSYQSSEIPSKIQFGSAWWYNDHIDGMLDQMKTLASVGLLSRFVGMLTDSRSFLSYPRHEYFRRILCNLVGDWVENGEYPEDDKMLKEIIQGICYYNAKTYFNF